MRRVNSWSEEDETLLRDSYRNLSHKQIAELLGRSVLAVKARIGVLGIGESRRWTAEKLQTLRDRYPDTPTQQLADDLGYGLTAVYRMANVLGLQKSEAFKTSPLSGRLHKGNCDERGSKHRFQKGLVPWNAGKKIGSHPNSAKTQFRKGQAPKNKRPVGTVVIVDGYKKLKIGEPNKWVPLHRHLWEEKHGPVPKRHVIAFIDRDSLNCVVENLECVSREEWILRHTLHNYPEPVKQQIHALAGFKRKLNRYAKKQDRRSQEHPV